ncbi:FH2 domain-containing protein 1-like [Lacerta agilis]|uniref:FH2 domain-containing protein 1-like n=1 Tax=Lacerta agilis TaxID=80427 RepID=UPI001419F355|nr:FH2 domain-containing protein 1-like [Lacerta agilis]
MVTVRSSPASPTDWTGPAATPDADASSLSTASLPPDPTAVSPPLPPPPPPPIGFSPGAPRPWPGVEGCSGRRPARLRNFNWEAIPAERIRGRHNLWTAPGRHRGEGFPLDLALLEELFGQRPEPPGGSLRGQPQAEQVSLLDSKKILNLGIFLKQFKRPVQEIVADIQDGAGALYGAEKLLELTKMLPDAEEAKKLAAFQGCQSRLSEAEVFALLLVQVPSYVHRLKLLVLQEEFFPQLNSLQSAIQILTEAALELLECEELHKLLQMVLKAGNYMNEGGYAGSALGFRMSSLLRLTDTKANRPGMDLLHFVALEAEKKDPTLLQFPSRLQHVGPASRIVDQEVMVELESLGQRLLGAQGELEGLGLGAQVGPFVQVAVVELQAVRASQEGLSQTAATLCDFLCEDPETFNLTECCRIFHSFGERFLAAVQDNQAREAAVCRQQRQERERQEKQKRRSIATCSARDPGLQDVELDLFFLRPPRSRRRNRSQQGLRLALESPQSTRERAPTLGRRRHTLTTLPPCTEPPRPVEPEAAPATPTLPAAATPPGCGKKAGGLFGQGLKAFLRSPPMTTVAASPQGPASPEAPSGFRFPTLFQKKTPLEGPELPTSPLASPKDVSALVGFFRRLSVGEKPRQGAQV